MNLDLFRKRREFGLCKYDWKEYFLTTERSVKNVLAELDRFHQ
jgi:hypothetical protein